MDSGMLGGFTYCVVAWNVAGARSLLKAHRFS